MKIASVLILLLINSFSLLIAQNTHFACNYTSNAINEKSICNMFGFQNRPEAQRAVEDIVKRSGLRQNFYVMECPNIDNCFAATRNGERLIVYDASFMQRVNNITKTDWGALSVLAHEIGHHLQGHTLKQGGSDPFKELEADEFSGFVMYQMGASLKEAQSAIFMLTTDHDYGTHPPRTKRLKAIEKGYMNAKELYPRISNASAMPEIQNQKNTVEKPFVKEELLIEEPVVIVENKVLKTGCVEGDCANGFGVAINHKTYEKYEGNWNNGRRSGYGIEFYADGLKKFEGNFLGSSYHGFGTFFFKNGEKLVGTYKKGIPHGDNMVYYFSNGDRLLIRYTQGQKQGKGRLIYYSGLEKTVFYKDDVLVSL